MAEATGLAREAEARRFFEMLFGRCKEGYVFLSSLKCGMAAVVQKRLSDPDAMETLASAVASAAAVSDDVYHQVTVLEIPVSSGRGSEAGSLLVPALWADVDCMDADHPNRLGDVETLAILDAFKPEPSLIVHSGGGYHAYWLLGEPLRVNGPEDINAARRANSGVKEALKRAGIRELDTVKDLARVLRPAGSVNWKPRYGEGREVTIERSPGHLWDWDVLSGYFGGLVGEEVAGGGSGGSDWAGPDTPANLGGIVEGCVWLQHCRDDAAELKEPEWFAMTSILARAEDGRSTMHQWSAPHPGYSAEESNQKFNLAVEKNTPFRCQTVRENFDGDKWCQSCAFKTTVTSPVQLGRRETWEAKAQLEDATAVWHERALTDDGNSLRFYDLFNQRVRYVPKWKGWLVWDELRWARDERNMDLTLAQKTVRSITQEADLVPDQILAGAVKKWGKSSQGAGHINSISKLATGDQRLIVTVGELDRHDWLLNVRNGTLDLRWEEGKKDVAVLREARREDMLTQVAACDWDPSAECPLWDKFMLDVTGGDIEMIAFLRRIAGYTLTGSVREHKFFFLYGTGRNGKALALDTPIPTPDGWTTQGDLHVGDEVFSEDGAICQVTWLSPVWEERPCYRITFSDNTSIVADRDHEWVVENSNRYLSTRTTKEIAQTVVGIQRQDGRQEFRWGIPMPKALKTPDADLPLDPYIFGAWLGDGNSRDARITCGDLDVKHFIAEIEGAGYYTSASGDERSTGTVWSVGLRLTPDRGWRGSDTIVQRLRSLDVLQNKHIPNAYLRASESQRLALLQGLMDTDGSTLGRQAQCEYTSTSFRLAEGVVELARSLGLRPVMHKGVATLYGREIGPKYRILFSVPAGFEAFRLERKRLKCRARKNRLLRKVISCEPVASVPVRCIEVDTPSHLYLAGESMVPTHNSTAIHTLRTILGDYGMTAEAGLLMESRGDKHTTGTADLFGQRMVVATESKSSRRMDEEVVKSLTGDDEITARRLYENNFGFEPSHKLWLMANTKPIINDATPAMWARLVLIPFEVQIPEADMDRNLREKMLEKESPGILRWMVEGCLEWQRYGLVLPRKVIEATQRYRDSEDLLGRFLTDRMVVGVGEKVTTKDLMAAYGDWCFETSAYQIPTHQFREMLEQRGFLEDKHCLGRDGKSARGYRGLRLFDEFRDAPVQS